MSDPFAAFNAGVTRARAEYAEHPSVFADPALCPNCLHPRIRRNCDDCRAADRMRTNRARRKHMNVQTDKPELPPVTKSEARMQADHLRIVFGRGEAVAHRIDQGYDKALNWEQTLEVTQHPTEGLKRAELVEIIAYLGAQLVGRRNSANADAELAMNQIRSTVREYEKRHGGDA